VIAGLARARGADVDELRQLTTANAARLFGDFTIDYPA
jgi:hypothetical protein